MTASTYHPRLIVLLVESRLPIKSELISLVKFTNKTACPEALFCVLVLVQSLNIRINIQQPLKKYNLFACWKGHKKGW